MISTSDDQAAGSPTASIHLPALTLSRRKARTVVGTLLALLLLWSGTLPAQAALPDVKIPVGKAYDGFGEILGEVPDGTVINIRGSVYVGRTGQWRLITTAGDSRVRFVAGSIVLVDETPDPDTTTVRLVSPDGTVRQTSTVAGTFEAAGPTGFVVAERGEDYYLVPFGSTDRRLLDKVGYVDDWTLGAQEALAKIDGSWRAFSLTDGTVRDSTVPAGVWPSFDTASFAYAAYDGTARRVGLCRSADPGAAFDCTYVPVNAGSATDEVDARILVRQSTLGAVVSNYDTEKQFLVRAAAAAVPVPEMEVWTDTAAGPEMYDVRGDKGSVFRLRADGTAVAVAVVPLTAAFSRFVTVSPTTVAGGDSRPADGYGSTVWRRSLTGGALGPETLLPGRATAISLSGLRLAVSTDRNQVTFYDGATRGRTVTGALASGLSGPQALIYRPDSSIADLTTADGRRLGTLKEFTYDPALFGTRTVVNRGNRLVVIDLAAGNRVLAKGPASRSQRSALWGDWIVSDLGSFDDSDRFTVVNVRTGASRTVDLPGYNRQVVAGDGFALLGAVNDDFGDVVAWNFADGKTVRLGSGRVGAVDGNRAAWIDSQGAAHVTTLPFGGRSAPRVLGTLGATSFVPVAKAGNRWAPQFDLTKPTRAGQLTILAGKTVVRTLPVKASADGSIRGLAWDGRDAKKRLVKAGAYRWVLNVTAADGTGAARTLDGTTAAGGTVAVRTAAFAKAPKPTISGSARVGKKLTARPGTWSPKPALSYQWRRNGAVIKGATKSTYTLAKADTGKVITVTVTGRRDGYTTTGKTSAGTAKVR